MTFFDLFHVKKFDDALDIIMKIKVSLFFPTSCIPGKSSYDSLSELFTT
jgi:hypothetical protein